MKRVLLTAAILLSVFLTACGGNRKLPAERVYEIVSPSTVEITAEGPDVTNTGTGFFDDKNGTVVTNYHVIQDAVNAYITVADGERFDILQVLGYSKKSDIAILSTSCQNSVPIQKRESPVKTGEKVYALGSAPGLTGTFSEGIISTNIREIDGISFIQTTAPISPENSGGPLIDEHGRVVGITCAYLSDGQSLNLAVPIAETTTIDRSKPITLEALFTLSNPFEEVKQFLLDNTEEGFLGGYGYTMATHDPYAAVGVSFSVTYYRQFDGKETIRLGIYNDQDRPGENTVAAYICLHPYSTLCDIYCVYSTNARPGAYEGTLSHYETANLPVTSGDVPIDIVHDGMRFQDYLDFRHQATRGLTDAVGMYQHWLTQNGLNSSASDFGFAI